MLKPTLPIVLLLCGIIHPAEGQRRSQPQTAPVSAPAVSAGSAGGNYGKGSFRGAREASPVFWKHDVLERFVKPLYRKPTSEELITVSPEAELLQKHSLILSQPGTGLAKLIVDIGCADSRHIVSAEEKCLKYQLPGNGNSFSFRTHSYRLRQLADITYSGGRIVTTGVLAHGVIADIGDVPLESVSVQSPAVQHLQAVPQSGDIEGAKVQGELLRAGFERGGIRFSRSVAATIGRTYVLRSIAYRGKVQRSVRGVNYNELDFDKRRDVIVVIKVVGIDPEGNVTILYKVISDMRSPRLRNSDGPAPDPLKFSAKRE